MLSARLVEQNYSVCLRGWLSYVCLLCSPVYVCTYVCMRLCVCMHVSLCLSEYVYAYVCVCVCVSTRMTVNTCMCGGVQILRIAYRE